MKKTSLLLSLLFPALLMMGQISVEQLSYANMPACDGVIEVFAEGTAGPFTVEVVQYGQVVKQKTPIPNGENSIIIEGLCDGKHLVNVTNNFGCTTPLYISIARCEFKITNQPTLTKPSACGAKDGRIRFFAGAGLEGGTGPYSYTWTNREGETILPFSSTNNLYITNLGSSIYTLTIEDVNGCKATADYDLLSENEPNVTGLPTASCAGEDNGIVSIVGTMPPPQLGNVNFYWSTGAVFENAVVGTIEDLSPGTYTVTITDLQGICSIERSYVVEERASTGPFTFTSSIGLSCSSDNNGSIDLQASGGNPPYQYRWEEWATFGASRSDLAGGNYCVTITDDCEREIRECFDIALPEPEIEIIPTIGCEGSGVLTANLTGGVPPFRYSWTRVGGFDINPTAEGLERGEHCVRVIDGNQCQYTSCYDLQLPGIIITEFPPCQGLNDGSIAIEIFNPFLDELELFFDNAFELTVGPGTNSTINIDDLHGDVEYNISGIIGVCEISESFTLGEKPTRKEFSEYRKSSDECVYDIYCGDNLLVRDGLVEGSTLSYATGYGGGWPTKCRVPRYCGDEKVGKDKKFPRKKVKVLEYLEMMRYLRDRPGLVPFPDPVNYIETRISRVLSKYGDNKLCRKMKYCTASLNWASGVASVGTNEYVIEPIGTSGECFQLTCAGISSNTTFCISDIAPAHISENLPSPPEVEYDCQFRTYKIQQLLLWYDDLWDMPEFHESLGEGIITLKDFLNNVWADPEKLEKAPCANVSFCKTDFRYIWDGLHRVDCTPIDFVFGDPLNPCELQTHPNDPFVEVAHCRGADGIPIVYNINEEFNIDLFSIPNPPNENGSITKVLSGLNVNSDFVNLGVVRDEEGASPLGFFNTDLGAIINEFSPHDIAQVKSESPAVIQYLDDIEDDVLIYVEKISESKSVLWFENEYSSWSQTIETPSNLKISHLSKKNHSIYVGGTFAGYLGYEEQKIFNDKEFSGFLLEINHEGQVINQQIVENINPTTDFLIEDGLQGILLSGESQETTINVNGQFQEIQDGGIFNVKISSESVTTSTEIRTQGNIETKKVIQALENGMKTYLFQGEGSINVETLNYGTITHDAVALKVNENGSMKWFKRFRSTNGGEIKSLDIVSGDDQSVYVGLTFSGGLDFSGERFFSQGGEDILIFKLGEEGNLIDHKQYGTIENERVMKLFYNTGVLYFGGEFAGENKEREIGKFRFLNYSNSTNNAYVSYLFDTDFEKGATERSEEIDPVNDLQKAMIAIPNPFSDQVTIEANEESITQLAIYNTLGEQVAIHKLVAGGIWKVDFSDIPKGLYILRATDGKGRIVAVESIVHQ